MLALDAIETFCAIVETANFREAADRLYRTQPAVTQQLKRLENELDLQLYDRKNHRPTPHGEQLYELGKRLLQQAVDIQRALTDNKNMISGALNVGTSDTNALYFLPRYLAQYARKYPHVQLEVYSRSTDLIAGQVLDGNLDLGIVTLPIDQDGLNTKTLFEQRLVLVVPHSHKLANRTNVHLHELERESFVLLEEGTRTGTLLRKFFEEHGFTPTVSMHSGSFEVIKRYVIEGLGISIIPEIAISEKDGDNLVPVTIPNLPTVGIGIIQQAGRYQSRAAEAFLNELQSDSDG